MPKPAIGRIVHYYDPSAVGDEDVNAIRCRAAIITEVIGDRVGLCVLTPASQMFCTNVEHHEGDPGVNPSGGLRLRRIATWHWPEREDADDLADRVNTPLGRKISDEVRAALKDVTFRIDPDGNTKAVCR